MFSVLQTNTLMKCLEDLDHKLIGVLRRHIELFNFKDKEEIGYLAMHVQYVKNVLCGTCDVYITMTL